MKPEQLQAIRERVNKATPRPWKWDVGVLRSESNDDQWKSYRVLETNYHWITDDDAEFIAHAREDVPALLDEIERLRLPVRWFAEQMEAKLRANDHKGGWEQCDPRWLFDRLREEVTELAIELHRSCACRDSDCPHVLMTTWDLANKKRVIEEAADVANFALMIADIARQALAGEFV